MIEEEIRELLSNFTDEWIEHQIKRYEKIYRDQSFNKFCYLDLSRLEERHAYTPHDEFSDFDGISIAYEIIQRLEDSLTVLVLVDEKVQVIEQVTLLVHNTLENIKEKSKNKQIESVLNYFFEVANNQIRNHFAQILGLKKMLNSSEINFETSLNAELKRKPFSKKKLKEPKKFFRALLELQDANENGILSDEDIENVEEIADQFCNLFLGKPTISNKIIRLRWKQMPIDYLLHKFKSYQTKMTPEIVSSSGIIYINEEPYKPGSKANSGKFLNNKNPDNIVLREIIDEVFNEYTIEA